MTKRGALHGVSVSQHLGLTVVHSASLPELCGLHKMGACSEPRPNWPNDGKWHAFVKPEAIHLCRFASLEAI
jgi:hypothetical protein